MFENNVPSPIFIGTMVDHLKYVRLDKTFLPLDNSEQMVKTKKLIRQHYKQLEGKLSGFGKIIHYVLRTDFDENKEDILLFDIEGNLMIDPDKDLRRFQAIPAGITIGKGKRIDWMFKLKPLVNVTDN